MKGSWFPTLLLSVACTKGWAGFEDPYLCGHVYRTLEDVPHLELTRSAGALRSLWDGTEREGCAVVFVTNERVLDGRGVPDFSAAEGAGLYRMGWRANDSYRADGPGTSPAGVERGAVRCLVRRDQPAHLDDQGDIVQSDTLRIEVQCVRR